MDTIATFQLWQEVEAQLLRKPEAYEAYVQAQALSAPLMYMMTRGLLVDESAVQPLHDQFIQECKELEAIADQITKPLLKAVINFSSPKQVIWMFECLSVKMPTKRDKGVTKKRTDREGFEQIAKQHPDLSPLVNIIMAWRDRAKMLTVLNPELYDADNRMRTFYKVAGTVTDRLASAKNALWTGMNMQNVKRDEDEEKTGRASIRSIFVADPGKKFLNIDLKGADSWGVGLGVFEATGDPSYLDACGSRDLHTHVARLVWPERPWTGDWSHDKALAEEFFYRQYDYRFMCKKGGHGSNYLARPHTISLHMKIPIWVAERFQRAYFKEFPGIPKWHRIKARELQTTGMLRNQFGRVRHFHSRLDADSTLREAIGWLGQSCTAGTTNRGMLNVWALQCSANPAWGLELMAQVHDSLLMQFNEAYEAEVLAACLEAMSIPLTAVSPTGESRTATIPLEPSVGWNWAKLHKNKTTGHVSNPDGLIELKPGQTDERTRLHTPSQKKERFMDKRLSGVHRVTTITADFSEVGSDLDDWSLSGAADLGYDSEAA